MSLYVEKLGMQHVITYSLKKGINKFGQRGRDSVDKEMKQLINQACLEPIHKSSLNPTELKRAMESLLFIVEKKDGTVKAWHCTNGSSQCKYMGRQEVSSPTVSTESTLLTTVI